ncbi:hypothetical protein ACFVVM_13300 [Nocardia sp. NPDC058176]|uniref:hypothetical protein n=1 Tax=Nocardia sp. NPDC058176 TaxID=3346368 RepID=UPI0036DF339E
MGTEPERRVELGKDAPRVQDAAEPTMIAPPPAPAASSELPWAGIEHATPPAELPPYPPPPPGPVFPAPGYASPGAYGAPRFPVPPPYPPQQLPPRYGYVDSTPIWSILSFCCVAASVLGGAMLCGLPVLVTAPTGIVLGIVGHSKGEQMGKWAAIANGVVAALAAFVIVLLFVLIGSA